MSVMSRNGVRSLLPGLVVPQQSTGCRDTASLLLPYQQRFGFSPHSLVALSGAARGWESQRADGAVAYLPVGNTWLASEPLADVADLLTVASEFMEFARKNRALPAFIPVTSRFAWMTREIDLDCAPIGMSPYFDLASWTMSGRRAHGLRSGIRQADRSGVTVGEVAARDWPACELEAVTAAWSASRKTGVFGWVFAPDRNFLAYKKLFVARDAEGKVAGFATATPLPARQSFYLEDIQRAADAPKGTTDLLFSTALRCLRDQGAESITLGTVPLHGLESPDALRRGMYPIVSKGLKLLAKHGESVYNFAGVYTFKSRLSPSWWEHEYAVAPRGNLMTGARVAAAALRAIMPAGVLSTVFFTPRNGTRNHA